MAPALNISMFGYRNILVSIPTICVCFYPKYY